MIKRCKEGCNGGVIIYKNHLSIWKCHNCNREELIPKEILLESNPKLLAKEFPCELGIEG